MAETGSMRRWLSKRRICGPVLGLVDTGVSKCNRFRAIVSLPTPGKPFRRRRKGGGGAAILTVALERRNWAWSNGASSSFIWTICSSGDILLVFGEDLVFELTVPGVVGCVTWL